MVYPHKYKYGKQEEVMDIGWFIEAMQRGEAMGETLDKLAYLVSLWYLGGRKSEVYELELEPHQNVTVTEKFVAVDLGRNYGVEQGHRKKHGAKVPPLQVPREWYGVEEWLIPHIFGRIASKPPHRWTKKRIRWQVDTGKTKTRLTRSGRERTVPAYEWREEEVRAVWLFPRISGTTAAKLMKRVFGDKYYPHYLRLRALSEVGGNPETASYEHIKSFSGIKSIASQQAYLGVSKRAQQQATMAAGRQQPHESAD